MRSSLFLLYLSSRLETQAVPTVLRVKQVSSDYTNDSHEGRSYYDLDINLGTSDVTFSGFSSGSYLTANLLAMFSRDNDVVKGGAMIAGGGPCATRNWCYEYPAKGYGTEGLADLKVYVWGGTRDSIVQISEPQGQATWFRDNGADIVEEIQDYEHTFSNAFPITSHNPQGSCTNMGMINCQDDLAGKYLTHITGQTLSPWNLNYNNNGQLYQFDQSPFHASTNSLMLDFGFLYVPDQCLGGANCKLHVFFHGCTQTAGNIGTYMVRRTALIEYASTNNIVLIFPQNWDPSGQYLQHCWAGGGQSDIAHHQIQTICNIINGVYNSEVLKCGDPAKWQVQQPPGDDGQGDGSGDGGQSGDGSGDGGQSGDGSGDGGQSGDGSGDQSGGDSTDVFIEESPDVQIEEPESAVGLKPMMLSLALIFYMSIFI